MGWISGSSRWPARLMAMLVLGIASTALQARAGESAGRVFIVGFEVDPIAGVSEEQIAREGCAASIGHTAFRSALLPKPEDLAYDPRNVRAEVIFPGGEAYFIDALGVVRAARGGYFALDRRWFEQSVKQSGCKRAPR